MLIKRVFVKKEVIVKLNLTLMSNVIDAVPFLCTYPLTFVAMNSGKPENNQSISHTL